MNSSLTVDLLSEYKKGTVALTPSELQHENDAQSPLHYSPPDADSLSDGAVSMTSRESAHFSSDMQQFFSDVEVIKKHIRSIQAGTGRMTHMGTSYGMATTSAQESALSAETSKVVAESSKCAQIAKQMITLMRENNERLRISPSNKQGEQRIRENLTNTLTRKFVEVMKDYQNSQQLFKVSIKKKVTRQVRIVHPKATPEEVETIVRNPEAAAGLFQKAILDVSTTTCIYFVVRFVSVLCVWYQTFRCSIL
jgi:t-SNARE complex subunit (syntaxin)